MVFIFSKPIFGGDHVKIPETMIQFLQPISSERYFEEENGEIHKIQPT